MKSFSAVRSYFTTICCLLMVLGVPGSADEPIRVAVFQGGGVGASASSLIDTLTVDGNSRFDVRRITADEIRSGELSKVDVLIHPGGSGSRQAKALGEEGREAVTKFVDGGGGYLGVCAGGYLATNDYSWSLNLIDAKVVDRKHWARGKGTVSLEMSPTGSVFFGHTPQQINVHYGQGPLLSRREWDDKEVPDYQSLAIYESEIAEKGAPSGVMPGTSAIVRARYGAGRVFCFSPHPEVTAGREFMIPTAVDWLAPKIDNQELQMVTVSRVVRRHFPVDSPGGIAVLVTHDGQPIHRSGYGFVKGRHLTTQSTLSLASVSKQYAAMCAAMLIEEGKLDSKAKVSLYLPDLNLQSRGRELLVQDLLWHTSGLPNFIQAKEKAAIAKFRKQRGLESLNNRTHAQWLATMESRRPPGQEFEYTNSGYVLLTRIIEVITGEPFHEFQQRRIFDVLDLTATTDSVRFNGSGNMKTTLIDYTKWDQALWKQDPRLLTPAGYKMLFTQGVFDNGEPIEYGFGWCLNYRDGELYSADHGGGGSGTTAARNLVSRYFGDRTTVAIFAQEHPQLDRAKRGRLVDEIYEAVVEHRSAQ